MQRRDFNAMVLSTAASTLFGRALGAAVKPASLNLTMRQMPSGAGHDAQAMAVIGPIGMIFIPSVSGISHSPKESSRPADIANGANVLSRSVLTADKTLG